MRNVKARSAAAVLLAMVCIPAQPVLACGDASDFLSLYFQSRNIDDYGKRVDCKIFALSRLMCSKDTGKVDARELRAVVRDANGSMAGFGRRDDPKKLSDIRCAADLVSKKFGIGKVNPHYSTRHEQMMVGILSSGKRQIEMHCGETGISAIEPTNPVYACLNRE